MSGVKVQASASGAGNFTVTSPNGGATDRTLTLPDYSGTIGLMGPAFAANRNAAAAVFTGGAWTVMAVDNEIYDSNGNYDPTTWKFTPQVAGWYQINYSVYITAPAVQVTGAGLAKNGSLVAQNTQSGSSGTVVGGSYMVQLNGTTDYVQLYGYGSGSPTIQPGPWTFLQGFFVHP